MNKLLTSATLLFTAVVLSTNVSAQFPQGAQPSPEQMQAAQEQMMNMMKPLIEEAFDNSDADDSDSLDKDELLEFGVEMYKVQRKLMAEQGMSIPELSEAELNEIKEEGKAELDESFKEADADESGDISQEEVLKVIFGDAYSEEEEEESESTSNDDDTNSLEDSEESESDAT